MAMGVMCLCTHLCWKLVFHIRGIWLFLFFFVFYFFFFCFYSFSPPHVLCVSVCENTRPLPHTKVKEKGEKKTRPIANPTAWVPIGTRRPTKPLSDVFSTLLLLLVESHPFPFSLSSSLCVCVFLSITSLSLLYIFLFYSRACVPCFFFFLSLYFLVFPFTFFPHLLFGDNTHRWSCQNRAHADIQTSAFAAWLPPVLLRLLLLQLL